MPIFTMAALKEPLRPARYTALLLVAGLMGGCSIFNELQNQTVEWISMPSAPKHQAEAASTHVGVIFTDRWDSYAQALQPNFQITADSALAQAIPATASYQSRLSEVYRLGVTAGFPQTGTTETLTQKTDAAGVTTGTSSRETTTKPGQAPALPGYLGSAAPGAAALPTLPGSFGEDPFLRYAVANGLFQEVTMLNRALAHAVVRSDVEPYLVRLQVAVIPYRRQLAFDAYSDISFFMRETGSRRPAAIDELPVVVPLLVTDSLETASDAASAEFVAELSAAITAAAEGVPISAQLQGMGDRLTSALATKRNALRTVTRLGENAIRVRLGATQQAGPTGRKTYELLPRTHTISLLVLAPKGAITIGEPVPLGIVERTTLKDVWNGDQLPLEATSNFVGRLDHVMRTYNIDKRFLNLPKTKDACEHIRNDVDRSDYNWVKGLRFKYVVFGAYKEYFKEARCVFTNGKILPAATTFSDSEFDANARADVEGLWQDLVSLQGDYAVHGQTIDLPAVPLPTLPKNEQTLILVDDGKAASTVRLSGGRGLTASSLDAALSRVKQTGSGSEWLPASGVSVDSSGITLTFPSLQQLSFTTKGKPVGTWSVVLAHPPVSIKGDKLCGGEPVPSEVLCKVRYENIRYITGDTRPPSPATVSASIPANQVVSKGGQGVLTVGVRLEPGVPARSAYIRVAGAEIETASGGDLDDLGRLKVSASGRVTLAIRNAAPGGKITVTAGILVPGKGGASEDLKATKTLEIVEGKP